MEAVVVIFFVMMFLMILGFAWFVEKIMDRYFGGIRESLKSLTSEVAKKNINLKIYIRKALPLKLQRKSSLQLSQ